MANTKITTNVIADDAITTAKIADDAVGNDQLASGLTLGGNTTATIATAAQPNITSLGTLTTLTVDDITIDGSTISDAGEFTLDIGGDINIDADGGDINFKDGGTLFGQISNSSGLYLVSSISDADIFIRGNDGGSFVNALTFDMSTGGNATFTGEVTFNKDIGLGMNGASFGTGVPTINFKGTSNSNTRAGALIFKENNDDNVAALYVTDGSDTYGTVLAAYQGDIKFSTATLAGYKMTIKADGKVGIGTTTPDTLLDIEYTASNHTQGIHITNSQPGGYGNAITFISERSDNNSLEVAARIRTEGAAAWNADSTTNSNLIFEARDANALTEKMRVTANGDLCVGVTSNAGSASNTKRLRAGVFATYQGATAATHNTPTTMFSLPGGLGTYILSAGFDGIGNTNAYSSCAIVHGDGTSYKMTTLTTSTSMSWDISGSNVRVQQSSGATLNVSWSMIRIQ